MLEPSDIKWLAQEIATSWAGSGWPDLGSFERLAAPGRHAAVAPEILLLLDTRLGALAILASALNAEAIEDFLSRPEYYIAIVMGPGGNVLTVRYFADEGRLAAIRALAFDLNASGLGAVFVGSEADPAATERVAAAGLDRCEPGGSA